MRRSGAGLFLLFTILLATSLPAAGGFCGRHAVMSTILDDGTEIGVFLPEERVARAPKWSPGEGEPPLSITRVVEIATDWARQTYTRYDDVRIESIGLNGYGCRQARKSWYYVVHFTPVIDGNQVYGGGNFAAVLMDGTVVGPRKK